MYFESRLGFGNTLFGKSYNDKIPYLFLNQSFIFNDGDNHPIKITPTGATNKNISTEVTDNGIKKTNLLNITVNDLFLLKFNTLEFNNFIMEYLYLMYEYQKANSSLNKDEESDEESDDDSVFHDAIEGPIPEGGTISKGGAKEDDKFLFQDSKNMMNKFFSSIKKDKYLALYNKNGKLDKTKYVKYISTRMNEIKNVIEINKKLIFKHFFFLTLYIDLPNGEPKTEDDKYYKTKQTNVELFYNFIIELKSKIDEYIQSNNFSIILGMINNKMDVLTYVIKDINPKPSLEFINNPENFNTNINLLMELLKSIQKHIYDNIFLLSNPIYDTRGPNDPRDVDETGKETLFKKFNDNKSVFFSIEANKQVSDLDPLIKKLSKKR
jgi:hypothetical protein